MTLSDPAGARKWKQRESFHPFLSARRNNPDHPHLVHAQSDALHEQRADYVAWLNLRRNIEI